MKRITVEEVVSAYKATGLKPARHDIVPFRGRCCALGAISACEGVIPDDSSEAYRRFGAAYGDYYIYGYWRGFDSLTGALGPDRNPDMERGFEDGQAAAAAVFAEAT